jgi:hypothetical protein
VASDQGFKKIPERRILATGNAKGNISGLLTHIIPKEHEPLDR